MQGGAGETAQGLAVREGHAEAAAAVNLARQDKAVNANTVAKMVQAAQLVVYSMQIKKRKETHAAAVAAAPAAVGLPPAGSTASTDPFSALLGGSGGSSFGETVSFGGNSGARERSSGASGGPAAPMPFGGTSPFGDFAQPASAGLGGILSMLMGGKKLPFGIGSGSGWADQVSKKSALTGWRRKASRCMGIVLAYTWIYTIKNVNAEVCFRPYSRTPLQVLRSGA